MRPSLVLLLVPVLVLAAAGTRADPVWRYGGDVRVRGYEMQNVWDWNYLTDGDHLSALRLRARLWTTVTLDDRVSATVRLANQNWGDGVVEAESSGDGWEQDNKSSKIFLDAAHIDVDSLFGLPADLRLGRQALMYGSGFVLFDGQSQLGSTAIYFDGARLRVAPATPWRVDLLWVIDQERKRSEARPDDITLMGAYFMHDVGADLYVLRRIDDAIGKDIVMYGGRAAHKFPDGFDLSLEAALQVGDAATGVRQDAFGAKAEIGWQMARLPLAPRPFVGYVGLSGDGNDDGVSQRWDVFYGGWPQFGELLAWTYLDVPGNAIDRFDPDFAAHGSVRGEAVYSSFAMAYLGLETTPAPRLSSRMSLAWIDGHGTPQPEPLGLYSQLQVKYAYSRHLAFSLYGGYLVPDDSYADPADPQYLVYWDAEVTF